MQIDLVMPKCGLTMIDATIVQWLRKEGDAVQEGDPLVEVETEKANMEVPAPSRGTLVRLLVERGAVVPVGGVLAILEVSDSADAHTLVFASALPQRRDTRHPSNSGTVPG